MEKSVLHYFQNVLGIKSIPRALTQPEFWLVTFVSNQVLNSDQIDLVEKMAKAMRLEANQWQMVHGNWAEKIADLQKSNHIVCFSEELFQNLKLNFPQLNLFAIPSPEQMIKEPQLKKQAWDVLKSLPT
jgi:hypothetical protein